MDSNPRFLCISVNPAIDKRARVKHLRAGGVNRVWEVVPEPGGKAAHVAFALLALGEAPLWIGFTGGASGQDLIAGLNAEGIATRSVPARESTRVNLAMLDDHGTVTEILEPGGSVSQCELDEFFSICKLAFAEASPGALVIFSGSLPPGAPDATYADLICAAGSLGCRTFLDTSGAALVHGLSSSPDGVKPNREEAEALTGKALTDVSDAKNSMQEIFARGAGSIALSMGRDGLLWSPSSKATPFWARPPVLEARSAVGSGDATLAGLAQSLARGLPAGEAARFAAACGAANCLAAAPARIQSADVRELLKSTTVEELG